MIHLVTIQDSKMSFILIFEKKGVQVNMATDMWLLILASLGGQFFEGMDGLNPKSLLDMDKKQDWVEQKPNSKPQLIRRPTGGGVVRHGTDLTYCLVLEKEVFRTRCHRCNSMGSFINDGEKL